MSKAVGIRELKTRLGSYLREVRRGRTIVVTDRGEPVAELRPMTPTAIGQGGRDRSARGPRAPHQNVEGSARAVPAASGTRDALSPTPLSRIGRTASDRLPRRQCSGEALRRRAGKCRRPGTARTQPVATCRLSEVEVASALARRCREGTLTRRDLDRALTALHADIGGIALVELVAEVARAAVALLARHSLRTGDSIQLASCLYLRRQTLEEVRLLAFDARLNNAARVEGLTLVG